MGSAHPSRNSSAHFVCRFAAKSQQQDLFGFKFLIQYPLRDGFNDGGGLARTGTRQHQQRTAAMIDHGLLLLV